MAGFLNWWDGAELWLSGRGFVLQAVIVMPVVLALAYAIAVILNVVLGWASRVFRGVEAVPALKVLRRRNNDGPQLDGPQQ